MVASYLFVKSKNNFSLTVYYGIYRVDGLVVFKGKNKVKYIREWLNKFQQTVHKVADNQHLQFSVEICKKYMSLPSYKKKYRFHISVTVISPFLDMNMSWSPEGDHKFRILRKRGQQLKNVRK